MSQDREPARRTDEPETPGKGRRAALIVVGSLVAAAVVGLLIFAGIHGASDDTTGSTSATSQTPDPSPSSPAKDNSSSAKPETPAVDPHFGVPVASSAPQGEKFDFGSGFSATVLSMKSTNVKGNGVGEISGPAIVVQLQVTNATAAPMSLDAIAVDGYYGSGKKPATPLNSATVGLQGSLAAGGSAQGKYTFSVPKDGQSSFVVTVGDAGSPVVVIEN